MRYRNLYVVWGLISVALFWLVADPDSGLVQKLPFGGNLVMVLMLTLKGVFGAVILYVTRKAMMDYPEADFQILGSQAKKEPLAAAVYAVAISIMTLAFAVMMFAVIAN